VILFGQPQSDTVEQAKIVAQKIIEKIATFQQFEHSQDLGASIGIGYSNQKQNFNDLLSAADKACYQAKKSGKGSICLKEVSSA
jgi:diguanylate cyclase (GGDEF)-like protein